MSMSQNPWSTELVVLFYLLCGIEKKSSAEQERLIHDLLWGRTRVRKPHHANDILGELLSVCRENEMALPFYFDTANIRFGNDKDFFVEKLETEHTKKIWQVAKQKKQKLMATKDANVILEILEHRQFLIDFHDEHLHPEYDEVQVMTEHGPEIRGVPNEDGKRRAAIWNVQPFQIAFDQLQTILPSIRSLIKKYLSLLESGNIVWDTKHRGRAKYKWEEQKRMLDKVLIPLRRFHRPWICYDDLADILDTQHIRHFHLIEDLLLFEQEGTCLIHNVRNSNGVLEFCIEVHETESKPTVESTKVPTEEGKDSKEQEAALACACDGELKAFPDGRVEIRKKEAGLPAIVGKVVFTLAKNEGKIATHKEIHESLYPEYHPRELSAERKTRVGKYVSRARISLKNHFPKYEIDSRIGLGWVFQKRSDVVVKQKVTSK